MGRGAAPGFHLTRAAPPPVPVGRREKGLRGSDARPSLQTGSGMGVSGSACETGHSGFLGFPGLSDATRGRRSLTLCKNVSS